MHINIVTNRKLYRQVEAIANAYIEDMRWAGSLMDENLELMKENLELTDENLELRKENERLEDNLTSCTIMLNEALDESDRLRCELEALREIINACRNPLENEEEP